MDSRLCKAARDGNLKLLEEIGNGDTGDTLLSTTLHENTALHMAAMHGHQEFAQDILGSCPSLLRKANAQGDSALHCAARAGNLKIVKLLTNPRRQLTKRLREADEEARGSSLERMKNSKDNTALHEALINGYTEVALHLLEIDDGLAEIVNKAGESPLFLAARRGLKEVVDKIVRTGRPFSQDGPNGQTPLHAAVMGTYPGFALSLWPLHAAGMGSYPGTVKLLLETMPGLITCVDTLGNNALHYAVMRKSIDTIEMLLTENDKLGYVINKAGRSPLVIGVHLRCPSAVDVILKHCPELVEQLDEGGKNALHIAASANDIAMVEMLVKKPLVKVLINRRDKEGNTPLHLANKKDFVPIEMLLLKVEGVDLLASNNDGIIASSWRYTKLWPRQSIFYTVLKFQRVMNFLGLPLIDSYSEWKAFAKNTVWVTAILAIMALFLANHVDLLKPDIPVDPETGMPLPPYSYDFFVARKNFIAMSILNAVLAFTFATFYLALAIRDSNLNKLKGLVCLSWLHIMMGLLLVAPVLGLLVPVDLVMKLLPTMLFSNMPPGSAVLPAVPFMNMPPEPASYIALKS